MQPQDVVFSLSIAALILSILAIVFEIVFFIIQTKQATGIMKDNSSFTVDMKTLLNEIRTSQSMLGACPSNRITKVVGL